MCTPATVLLLYIQAVAHSVSCVGHPTLALLVEGGCLQVATAGGLLVTERNTPGDTAQHATTQHEDKVSWGHHRPQDATCRQSPLRWHAAHTHPASPVVLHAGVLDVVGRATHLAKLVALAGQVLAVNVHVNTRL